MAVGEVSTHLMKSMGADHHRLCFALPVPVYESILEKSLSVPLRAIQWQPAAAHWLANQLLQ